MTPMPSIPGGPLPVPMAHMPTKARAVVTFNKSEGDVLVKEAGPPKLSFKTSYKHYDYYCTKCDQHVASNCSPDTLSPSLLLHATQCLDTMWWSDASIQNFRQVWEAVPEVVRMAILRTYFQKLSVQADEEELRTQREAQGLLRQKGLID